MVLFDRDNLVRNLLEIISQWQQSCEVARIRHPLNSGPLIAKGSLQDHHTTTTSVLWPCSSRSSEGRNLRDTGESRLMTWMVVVDVQGRHGG